MDRQPRPAKGINRRKAMVAGGGTVAAIGAFAASPLSNPLISEVRGALAGKGVLPGIVSLANATYEEWQSLVGASFALGGGATMTLAGVRALPSGGVRPLSVSRRQAFLGVFNPAPRQSMAGDLIYTATHARYGPVQLFLTNAPAPGAPTRMHAVFN